MSLLETIRASQENTGQIGEHIRKKESAFRRKKIHSLVVNMDGTAD